MLLAACGGSGSSNSDNDNKEPHAPVNVAAASNGATISLEDAVNLIDGDDATSWTSGDGPVVIHFGGIKNVSKITLTRVNASASLGSTPDILIELSTDGITYTKSNVSIVFGGADCFSQTVNATKMECTMTPSREISHVRISTPNDKYFDLIEFEAISVQ